MAGFLSGFLSRPTGIGLERERNIEDAQRRILVQKQMHEQSQARRLEQVLDLTPAATGFEPGGRGDPQREKQALAQAELAALGLGAMPTPFGVADARRAAGQQAQAGRERQLDVAEAGEDRRGAEFERREVWRDEDIDRIQQEKARKLEAETAEKTARVKEKAQAEADNMKLWAQVHPRLSQDALEALSAKGPPSPAVFNNAKVRQKQEAETKTREDAATYLRSALRMPTDQFLEEFTKMQALQQRLGLRGDLEMARWLRTQGYQGSLGKFDKQLREEDLQKTLGIAKERAAAVSEETQVPELDVLRNLLGVEVPEQAAPKPDKIVADLEMRRARVADVSDAGADFSPRELAVWARLSPKQKADTVAKHPKFAALLE